MYIVLKVSLEGSVILTKHGFKNLPNHNGKKFPSIQDAQKFLIEKYDRIDGNIFYRDYSINSGQTKTKDEIKYLQYLKDEKKEQEKAQKESKMKSSIMDAIFSSTISHSQATSFSIDLEALQFTKEQLDYLYKHNCKG